MFKVVKYKKPPLNNKPDVLNVELIELLEEVRDSIIRVAKRLNSIVGRLKKLLQH